MLPFCQAVMERSLWPSEESQSRNTSGCTLPPLTAVKEITLVDSLWIFVIFSHSTTSFKYLIWVDLRCIWHQLYQTLGELVHQLHLDLWKDLWQILLICWSCSILFTLLRCTGMHLQGVIWWWEVSSLGLLGVRSCHSPLSWSCSETKVQKYFLILESRQPQL